MLSHRQFPLAARLAVLLIVSVVSVASAHRIGADCKVTGKQVEVEAFYDDGAAARGARVTVRDAANKTVTEGRTDAKGRWTSSLSLPGRYQVEVNAGEGHRANATFIVPPKTPEDIQFLIRRIKSVGAEGIRNAEAYGGVAVTFFGPALTPY